MKNRFGCIEMKYKMKIKEITSQNRRDFYAIYECEGCSNEENGSNARN